MTSEPRSTQSAPAERAATATAADFGPGGYLPERAARRARKIVLRAPMGLQWPAAAAVTAVLVAVVGLVYLMTASGPPGPPYVPAGPLGSVDPRGSAILEIPGLPAEHGADAAAVTEVLVVRGAGGLAAFAAPADRAEWCPDSGRIESGSQVWTAEGRLVGGDGASLRTVPVRVHDGVLYVDSTSPGPGVPAADRGEAPACA